MVSVERYFSAMNIVYVLRNKMGERFTSDPLSFQDANGPVKADLVIGSPDLWKKVRFRYGPHLLP
jgi:hypothetical protein